MPTTLVRSNVDVIDEEGNKRQRVTIQLMAGSDTAKIISRQGAVLHELAGAGDYTRPSSKRWTIPFADGSEWTVIARSGCGCGGR